jgi:hypothetical protein
VLLDQAGEWVELGPFAVDVTDGALNVGTNGTLMNLSGIEIWRETTGNPPTPAPTPTPGATSTPGAGAFYRAVNLGGDALSIEGNAWEAGASAPNFTVNGFAICNPWVPLIPTASAARTTMLQCSVQHWAHDISMSSMPSGTYEVTVYAWQDWQDANVAPFSLSMEGTPVAPSVLLDTPGEWVSLGAYTVSVTDGTLNITTSGYLPKLSGIEVRRIN